MVPSPSGRVRVYIACSLDGFIAGSGDDLEWLSNRTKAEDLPSSDESVDFDGFMAEVGALLMGRRTFDVVQGFGPDAWAYATTPVLVATRRPLTSARESVRAVSGDIEQLVTLAREAAGTKDVYLDGGQLIRAALDAGLVDELIVTQFPTVLGAGIPLFAGGQRRELRLLKHVAFGDGVQLHLTAGAAADASARS